MAKPRNGSSRLFVKVAAAIDHGGPEAVEKHLDTFLNVHHRTHLKSIDNEKSLLAKSIVAIVATIAGVTSRRLKAGKGETGRFAMNISYHFIKDYTDWNHDQIAKFFGKSSHGSISYGINQIRKLDKENKFDKQKLDLVDKINSALKKDLKNIFKK